MYLCRFSPLFWSNSLAMNEFQFVNEALTVNESQSVNLNLSYCRSKKCGCERFQDEPVKNIRL